MLDELIDILCRCSRCAVLTGAGISAESGVPTFRGKQGLWGKFRPEQLATMDAFMASPEVVWEWYNWRRQLIGEVKPNPGHYAIRDMAELFDTFTLITQNVDNLHRLAGSSDILELHGNIYRNKCVRCNRPVSEDMEIDPAAIPSCESCGGRIRPDVVWFGEMLPSHVIEAAFEQSEHCDVFFSVGTSALVHPAASLPLVAKRAGAVLVEVNPDETPLSELADFCLAGPSGEILPAVVEQLCERRGRPSRK